MDKIVNDSTEIITNAAKTVADNCAECDSPLKLVIILAFVIILCLIFRKPLSDVLSRLVHLNVSSREGGVITVDMDMEPSNHIAKKERVHISTGKQILIPHTESILNSEKKKKILWTLYDTQKALFKEDFAKRFTLILPGDTGTDANQLYWEGLITLDGPRYFLTNIGLEFCKQYESELKTEPYTYFRKIQ